MTFISPCGKNGLLEYKKFKEKKKLKYNFVLKSTQKYTPTSAGSIYLSLSFVSSEIGSHSVTKTGAQW